MARHAYLVNPPLYYAHPASFPRKGRRESTDDALHIEDSAEMSLFSTVLLVVALVVGGAFFIMSMAYVLSYEHHSNAAIPTQTDGAHALLQWAIKQTTHGCTTGC